MPEELFNTHNTYDYESKSTEIEKKKDRCKDNIKQNVQK